MSYSPILIAHICGGVVGLVSGTAAMCFRKGSPRHVLAGRDLCRIHAHHGRPCSVPCHYEASTQ